MESITELPNLYWKKRVWLQSLLSFLTPASFHCAPHEGAGDGSLPAMWEIQTEFLILSFGKSQLQLLWHLGKEPDRYEMYLSVYVFIYSSAFQKKIEANTF